MKVVNLEDFLDYPIGTLYKEVASDHCSLNTVLQLKIKLDNTSYYGDWFSYELADIDKAPSDLEDVEVPLDTFVTTRDCSVADDEEALFLVFDKADVEAMLINLLSAYYSGYGKSMPSIENDLREKVRDLKDLLN